MSVNNSVRHPGVTRTMPKAIDLNCVSTSSPFWLKSATNAGIMDRRKMIILVDTNLLG
jgi:hypothetical protein